MARDEALARRRERQGTDDPRDHPRGGADRHPDRRERLCRAQDRPHRRDVDPRRGDLDGGASLVQGLDDPGKQYRPDDRVGRRHFVRDRVRPSGPGDDRMVDRIPLLAVGRSDRNRRHLGRDVFGAAPPRAGDRRRPPLSRRPCRCGSAEGWRGHRRRRGESPRSASDRLELARFGPVLRACADEAVGFGGR